MRYKSMNLDFNQCKTISNANSIFFFNIQEAIKIKTSISIDSDYNKQPN